MRRMIKRTVTAALLAAAVVAGAGAAPAAADPSYIQLATNTMSPQYEVEGCRYRVMYGNFGVAYAQMRIYNPSSCTGAGVAIVYHDGTGLDDESRTFSQGYSTGTDGCGSYRYIQATAPVAGVASHAVTSTGTFASFRAYSADGLAYQPVHSTC